MNKVSIRAHAVLYEECPFESIRVVQMNIFGRFHKHLQFTYALMYMYIRDLSVPWFIFSLYATVSMWLLFFLESSASILNLRKSERNFLLVEKKV